MNPKPETDHIKEILRTESQFSDDEEINQNIIVNKDDGWEKITGKKTFAIKIKNANANICIENDCKKSFVLTPSELEFYKSKPSLVIPKRCKLCRIKRKNSTKN